MYDLISDLFLKFDHNSTNMCVIQKKERKSKWIKIKYYRTSKRQSALRRR